MKQNKTEEIFTPDGRNIVLNIGSETFGAYAEAYYQAARICLTEFESSAGKPDFIIYPILFLFRMWIELSLKDIIYTAKKIQATATSGAETRPAKSHDLDRLLKEIDNLAGIAEVIGFEPPILSAASVSAIQQMNQLDKSSQAFRYPKNIEGSSFFPKHHLLGYGQIRESMESLHDELVGLDECLHYFYGIGAESTY